MAGEVWYNNSKPGGGATTVAKAPKPSKKDTANLESIIKDFDRAWDYVSSSWHDRWKDNHSLYNGQRVKKAYEGITDTFVPMVFSTVETLTSALFGTKPKFKYLPPHDRSDQKTDILNALLDYYWDKDQWSIKVINTGRSCLKLGTAVDYLYWNGDHPVLLNIPIRDFFIDPTASSLETARYMGRRYLTTVEDLKTFEVVDPETGEMKPKYKNLDDINANRTGEHTDKEEKDVWYGSTLDEPKEKQVEVIEYWTKDKVVSVANREVIIEDSENYFKAKDRQNGNEFPAGLMPFISCRDYVDESLFYAKGEIDFIADGQELLNDLTNQNIDSITYTLNQMYTLDPRFGHLIEKIENLPGAVYPVEAGALAPIPQRPVPNEAFAERLNIKNEIREATASNEVVKGAATDGGKATATEINAQIAGSGQRIGLKVTQIENEYFQRLARIVFEMVKLYVTEPMMVRIMGKDGAAWDLFDPSEYQGDYEPKVQLDIAVENKKREQAAQAKEMLGAFLGDPDINQVELKKRALQFAFDLEPDEVEQYINPMPAMGMGIVPSMMGGQPPQDPSMGMQPPMPDMSGMEVDPMTGAPLMPQEAPMGAM